MPSTVHARRRAAGAVALLFFLLAACRTRPAATGDDASAVGRLDARAADDTAAAEAEVEALYRAGIAAFNRHALEEFTAQFADDVVMYTPTGWLRGRAAVDERFRATFAQFPRVRMVVDSLEVMRVGPAAATVAFQWRVYPMGQGPAFHGVGSGVYVRRAGRWQEVLEHETVTRVDSALQQRRP